MSMPELGVGVPVLLIWGGAVAAMIAVAVLELRHRRAIERRLVAQCAEQAELRNALVALLACSRGIGERLHDQGTALRRIAEQPRPQPAPIADERARYQVALALADSGAEPDELTARCGLSRGEAELVRHLTDLKVARRVAA
ncbi:MAG: DUF2802 domain-containing protein [Gammaproteobacteria bacterium]